MKEKIFYLKINRNEGYTIRNLRHWLETISTYEYASYFIICDNLQLENKVIMELGEDYPEIKGRMLKSIIDEETKYIVEKVTNERWHMAGYAHISTFVHARNMAFDEFWNIDADDTRFCLKPARCRELLDEAERFAKSERIDCFSLDMHTSLIASGHHWSFGITYTNNSVDWMKIMKEACLENIDSEDQWPNIDRFFRYIRNHKDEVKIESFYCENLKFLHYSNDFFWRLNVSALYHWEKGYLILPILYYAIGLRNEKARMPIDSIVRKIDIGIQSEESTESMLNACNSPWFYLG